MPFLRLFRRPVCVAFPRPPPLMLQGHQTASAHQTTSTSQHSTAHKRPSISLLLLSPSSREPLPAPNPKPEPLCVSMLTCRNFSSCRSRILVASGGTSMLPLAASFSASPRNDSASISSATTDRHTHPTHRLRPTPTTQDTGLTGLGLLSLLLGLLSSTFVRRMRLTFTSGASANGTSTPTTTAEAHRDTRGRGRGWP